MPITAVEFPITYNFGPDVERLKQHTVAKQWYSLYSLWDGLGADYCPHWF